MAENSRSDAQQGAPSGQAGKPGGGGQQAPAHGARVSFFTSVLTAFLFLLAVIVLSFIAGVMNGRNYNIREENREYEQLLANGRHEQKNDQSGAKEPAATGEKQGILKPSELEYSRLLRSSKEEKSKPRKPLPSQTTQTPLVPQQAATAQSASLAPAPATSQDGIQPALPVLQNQGQVFDYTFQVASLKNEGAVDALREKLEGVGLRTKMERRGKVLVVLVLLRGDEARAQAVRDAIVSISRGTPLELGKKPVRQ